MKKHEEKSALTFVEFLVTNKIVFSQIPEKRTISRGNLKFSAISQPLAGELLYRNITV